MRRDLSENDGTFSKDKYYGETANSYKGKLKSNLTHFKPKDIQQAVMKTLGSGGPSQLDARSIK